ncbi:hypothetical protein SUGI_1156130 [Cryptomeria japonica]|nr:hypothetical protein SUGI_1156130 [Cryptomeria japonica]
MLLYTDAVTNSWDEYHSSVLARYMRNSELYEYLMKADLIYLWQLTGDQLRSTSARTEDHLLLCAPVVARWMYTVNKFVCRRLA